MIGAALIAGGIAGVASLPHCAVMCGPLAAFACGGRTTFATAWRYQAGRTLGYGALGAAAGALGGSAASLLAGAWSSAMVSWALGIALVVAAIRAWQRGSPRPTSAAARVWRPRSTGGARFSTARVLARAQGPVVLGLLTALLPCGALAAGAALAAGSGSAASGAATMVAFAGASGVALLTSRAVLQRLGRVPRRAWSRVLAVLLAVGALVLMLRPVASLSRGGPAACHTGVETRSRP